MPPVAWTQDRKHIEARTQSIGRDLLDASEEYSPGPAERIEDWLLTHAVADERFRARLLRFIDVLGSLDFPGSDDEVVRLLREYFDGDFPGLPGGLRWLLRIGRDDLVPVPVAARTARRAAEVFARRFIVAPGEDTVRDLIERLAGQGRTPSFDLLGEAVLSDAEAREYVERYLALIAQLATSPRAGERTPGGVAALQVSLKLSSLTHRFTPVDVEGSIARARPSLERICDAAREAGVGVTVDMEQYELRDLTWELFRRTFARGTALGDWPDAGIVVQAYLRDAHLDAAEAVRFARERGTPYQVRLVKGAYWDFETIVASANRWPAPVFAEKAHTDAQFERALELLIDAHEDLHLAVASHNPRSHARAAALAEAAGVPPGALEHQTLHRTAEGMSRGLVEMGWSSRDYVPVGELLPGMAYLVRRVLENSSQAGFLVQSRTGATAYEVLAPPPGAPPEPTTEVEPLPGPFQRARVAPWHDPAFREGAEHAIGAARADRGGFVPLVIGEQQPGDGERVEVRSPSDPDGPPLGAVVFAREHHVEPAVRIARAGLEAWSNTPARERAAILRRAAALLEDREHEFAAHVVHEGGRDRSGAYAEVEEALDFINVYAAEAERLFEEHGDRIAPHGVVAVIPPWNFSLAIPCGMTVAALLCGNTVILKPSEQTPLIAHHLVDLLHEAGVPRSALLYFPGHGGEAGRVLVEHPDVAMISFTGSREVGTWMHETVAGIEAPAGRFKALTAEMGGKNPIIVFADADLDEAVAGTLQSSFGHAGQKCSAASRVLVQRPVYERFRDRLVQAASSMVLGPADEPSTEINPIIEADALERLRGAADLARQEGTVLLDAFDGRPGSQLAGPLIVEVSLERALATRTTTEELFGPILPLIPFDDEEDAYRVANGTNYALTSGVFSRSPATIERASRAIEAGHVYVNRSTTAARPGVEPFGGLHRSGTGPKAGYGGTLWAYVRRTDVDPAELDDNDTGKETAAESGALAGAIRWDAPLDLRVATVAAAAASLEGSEHHDGDRLREAAERALAELGRPADTMPVAGQHTAMRYDIPRGLGIVHARGDDAASWLAAALLAGNAAIVVGSPALAPVIEALHAAGVPRDVLRTAGAGTLLALAGASEVAFAAADGGPLRALRRALAPTAPDQRWLRVLLSPLDGPQPGEAGFVQRFAWPRVVAVRTLRHGADLSLAVHED